MGSGYTDLCSKCLEEKPIAHTTPQGPSLFCEECEAQHETDIREAGYLAGKRYVAARVFNEAARALATDPRLRQPMQAAIEALASVEAEDYDGAPSFADAAEAAGCTNLAAEMRAASGENR